MELGRKGHFFQGAGSKDPPRGGGSFCKKVKESNDQKLVKNRPEAPT